MHQAGWVTDFTAWLHGLIQSLWESIIALAANLMQWFVGLVQPVLDWFGGLFGNLITALLDALHSAQTWFSDYAMRVMDWCEAFWDEVFFWANVTWESTIDYWTEKFNVVVGWFQGSVTDTLQWVWSLIKACFGAGVNFVEHLGLKLMGLVLQAAYDLVDAIPVPAAISNGTIGDYLGSAGSSVAWLSGQLRLGQCFAVIGAALAFRLLRKVLTLGQW